MQQDDPGAMALQAKKNNLRAQLRNERQGLASQDVLVWSQQLLEHLDAWLNRHQVEHILAFRSLAGEVWLNDWLQTSSQRWPIYLPVAYAKGRMEFYRYRGESSLKRSSFGIDEPEDRKEPLRPGKQSVLLVPALAFDRQGYRLGYGGGYYDRYIERFPSSPRIGLCFERFLGSVAVPKDVHDQAVQRLCSERGLWRCS